MKVMVAVKRVVDYNVKIRVKSDGSGVDLQNVKMSMNPFDEIAMEEAVRLKEKKIASEIIAVSIGSDKSQETLRTALAFGADRAILVKAEESLEPLSVAKILQHLVQQNEPQLVILGKQSIDGDHNQTGQMLAGLLHWPQATFASKLAIENHQATVIRETDAGLETIQVGLPAVITTDLRLNEPRYLSLPNIMNAKKKPLEVIELSELHLSLKNHTKILNVDAPPKRQMGIKVQTVEELVEHLKSSGVI